MQAAGGPATSVDSEAVEADSVVLLELPSQSGVPVVSKQASLVGLANLVGIVDMLLSSGAVPTQEQLLTIRSQVAYHKLWQSSNQLLPGSSHVLMICAVQSARFPVYAAGLLAFQSADSQLRAAGS